MSFWSELGRRNVVKVGLAYLVVAWLILQVASIVLPTFEAPAWVMQTITFVLVLLFPVVLIIAWAFEITPEGIKKTASVPLEQSITRATGQKLNYVVTTLLGIAVVVLVIDNYVLGDRVEVPAAADASGTAPVPPAQAGEASAARAAAAEAAPVQAPLPNSIAVIPFTNMSPNADDAYFAAGIHEEILNQLAKLGSLNVIARTSVMQYSGTQKTIPEIGRELNVEAVMEGSVRYADGRVLVTTQLIDVTTNVHLWSDSYPRPFANIFEIQSDIAMNVANALRAEYSSEEQASIEALPTSSIEAYDHYLLAQTLTRQGLGQTTVRPGQPDPRLRAIEEYEQTLALDPDFDLARLGLALHMRSLALVVLDDEDFSTRAEAAVDAAIELADELPAALALVAGRYTIMRRWADAEQAYVSWLGRVPENDFAANLAYGTFLKDVGRARESLRYLELAQRIDPLEVNPLLQVALAYDALGDAERAITLHARMENLVGYDFRAAAPQFWRLLQRDGEEAAFAVLAAAFDASPEEFRTILARESADNDAARAFNVFATNMEQPERGLEQLRAVFEAPDSNNFPVMLNVALLAGYYGDVELGVAALRNAATELPNGVIQFAWIPIMRDIRVHPDFKALVIELGLADYWRTAGWPEHCRPVGADDFECG